MSEGLDGAADELGGAECPMCGYWLDPLDPECPKCKGLKGTLPPVPWKAKPRAAWRTECPYCAAAISIRPRPPGPTSRCPECGRAFVISRHTVPNVAIQEQRIRAERRGGRVGAVLGMAVGMPVGILVWVALGSAGLMVLGAYTGVCLPFILSAVLNIAFGSLARSRFDARAAMRAHARDRPTR